MAIFTNVKAQVGGLCFWNGSEKEGIIIKIKTNSTRSIRNMDLHVNVFSEELF
jgi:hypothetical protein